MAIKIRHATALLLLFLATDSIAAGPATPAPVPGTSLAELAAKADLVALAQVRDTDYLYRRGFPVSGSAFLKVLIAYKGSPAKEIIEVSESGLHQNECYFQNPGVQEEGRRFLLFLRTEDEGERRFRGLAEGCGMDVLVDKDNQYVLRLPVTGIDVKDDLDKLAQAFEFSDEYSKENEESLSPKQRDLLLQAGLMVRSGEHYVYTRGVRLSDVRPLMNLPFQYPNKSTDAPP